jgi:hypothetical protein
MLDRVRNTHPTNPVPANSQPSIAWSLSVEAKTAHHCRVPRSGLAWSAELHIKQVLQTRRFGLTLIAETNESYKDFSPYVASLNDAGQVAFQAALRGGGTGVLTGNGEEVVEVARTQPSAAPGIYSHPDINSAGMLTFYRSLGPGLEEVAFGSIAKQCALPLSESLRRIGPLGPTMNEAGAVAFRGDLAPGNAGIFVGSTQRCVEVARTGGRFAAFQGLPVINNAGAVVFRADLTSGGQGIYLAKDGTVSTIVETSHGFRALGLFPVLNDSGKVAFVGVAENGESGIFVAAEGKVERLFDREAPFGAFRGVLLNRKGLVAFYAAPKTAQFGIYTGPDPVADKVVCIGDELLGSTVTEFALNPVSVNEVCQFAIRLRLVNNRQLIVRVDPN